MSSQRSLAEYWADARQDLDLSVSIPFRLTLPSGEVLEVPVLLRDFGAPNGMLIVSDFETVRLHVDTVQDLGFGFSTLADPSGPYHRRECIDWLLRDWGWSGEPGAKPTWL